MTPTEKGAFCQKCSNEVHDVSRMSNSEIIQMISSEKKVPCMRMTPTQERTLNLDLGVLHQSQKKNIQRAFLFSLLVVFGFTLFSCTDSRQIHERNILESVATSMVEISEMNQRAMDEAISIQVDDSEQKEAIQLKSLVEPQERVELGEPLLLGEPVVHEKIIDPIEIEEYDVVSIESHTMGVPAMIIEVDRVEPLKIVEREEISSEKTGVPSSFTALVYPNPAMTSTQLKVELPTDTEALEIRLLDLNGRILQNMNDASAVAGIHEFNIDLMNLKPAYYLVDVRYNDQHEVVRLSKAQ